MPPEFDLHTSVQGIHCIAPQVLAVDTNGLAIDTAGFESIEYLIHVGVAFAGGGFDVTLEGADDTGFTVNNGLVAAADILGVLPTIAIADANQVFRVGSIDKRQFQRLVLTETGTITAGIIGVSGFLGNPRVRAVADQST